jgi:phage gp29-like protein
MTSPQPDPSAAELQFAVSPRDPKPAAAVLYRPEAQYRLVEALGQLSELDAVLRKAGKTRGELRALEGDDEIAAALETRESAILATSWRLEPWEDNPIAKGVWEILEPHLEGIVRSIWSAVPYGYSVLEAVWVRRGGRLEIAEIQEKPFEWFEPTRDGRLLYHRDGLRLSAMGTEVDTSWKFFLTRRRPTYRAPMGDPLLSKVFWPWFFRSKGWGFWARFLERHGSPLVVGKTLGDVEVMADALSKLVNAGVAAFGDQDKVEAMAPGNAGLAFDHFSTAVDKRIQKVILGQTLTTDVQGGGSFAAAKVQNLIREDRLISDRQLIQPTLQRIVNAITWLNWPDADPPTITYDRGENLSMARADRDGKLVQAGVLRLTKKYLLDRYDFEDGDFEIADGQQGAPVPVRAARRGPTVPAGAVQFDARRSGGRRFTPDQEDVEALIDSAVGQQLQPIAVNKLRDAIAASVSPEDLAERLAAMLPGATSGEFQELLERALFAADVMGYAAAAEAASGTDPA